MGAKRGKYIDKTPYKTKPTEYGTAVIIDVDIPYIIEISRDLTVTDAINVFINGDCTQTDNKDRTLYARIIKRENNYCKVKRIGVRQYV